jgi:ankyrin repeat protein
MFARNLVQFVGLAVSKPTVTALHLAAANSNLSKVQRLVQKHGAQIVHEPGLHGQTALHFASKNDNVGLIEFLVRECGAPVEAADSSGNRPLHVASAANKVPRRSKCGR